MSYSKGTSSPTDLLLVTRNFADYMLHKAQDILIFQLQFNSKINQQSLYIPSIYTSMY